MIDHYPNPNPHIQHTNTNDRYKNFFQSYFTAGDEEQFVEKIMRDTPKSIPHPINPCISSNYIYSTFRYIFYKFKKGIFIQIRKNKLLTFLPFSNAKFINEWSDRIETDENLLDFLSYSKMLCGYGDSSKNINMNKETWYANNSLIRTEYPIHEGDTGVPIIHDMFAELCESQKVPDMDFFVNRRDYPLLRSEENGVRNEPYTAMFGPNTPLVSHSYKHYFPILSMSYTSGFDDIAIPTTEDWARIRSGEYKYFEHSRDYNYDFELKWGSKKSKAVFRGTATGSGTTIETNMRLKLASMGKEYDEIMDVGITGWSSRPRKEEGNNKLTMIDPKNFDFTLVPPLSPEEQSKFKYIINISGHVCAYRLSLELSMGSVVLLQESRYKMWYMPLLKPYIHYIPIKEDLSDLVETIMWCKEHDKECKKIAKSALSFYNKYLSKEYTLSFLQEVLTMCREKVGNYKFGIHRECIEEYVKSNKKIGKHKKYTLTELERYKNTDDPVYLSFYSALTPEINGNLLGNRAVVCKEIKTNYEYYIGLEINKILRYIPNFRYTFKTYKSYLILDKIEGMTFADYIQSEEFQFDEWVYLLCTIILSITFAQSLTQLTHYDLNPWNIMLRRKKVCTHYYIGEHTYTCTSNVYPIIIDYDKSRIILKDLKTIVGKTLTYNSKLDIIFLLYNSAYIILHGYYLEPRELRLIHDIIEKISNRKFESISSLKSFLNTHKKYSTILYESRTENPTQISNIEFVDWLLSIYPLQNIKKTKERIIDCRYGNRNVINNILNGKTQKIKTHTPSIDFTLSGDIQREESANFIGTKIMCKFDEDIVERLEEEQFRKEYVKKHSSKKYKNIVNVSNFKTAKLLIDNYK